MVLCTFPFFFKLLSLFQAFKLLIGLSKASILKLSRLCLHVFYVSSVCVHVCFWRASWFFPFHKLLRLSKFSKMFCLLGFSKASSIALIIVSCSFLHSQLPRASQLSSLLHHHHHDFFLLTSFQGHQKFLEYFICHNCQKLQWMPLLLWCVHFHSWLPRASSTTQFVTSHSCLCPKLAESFLNVFFVIGSL